MLTTALTRWHAGVLSEQHVRQGEEPSLGELREALIAVYGTDYGVHNVTWLSRFTDTTREEGRRERHVLAVVNARPCVA
jgi:hypothetical protein